MADGYGTTVSLLEPYAVGRGYPQVKAIASPAAGAGFTYALTGAAVEMVMVIRFQLATSAAVANRFARVTLADGDGAPIARFPVANAQAASLTEDYTFAARVGASYQAAGIGNVIPLPDIFAVAGLSWVADVVNIDAADQVSGIRVYTEVFPSGPTGEPSGPYTTAQP